MLTSLCVFTSGLLSKDTWQHKEKQKAYLCRSNSEGAVYTHRSHRHTEKVNLYLSLAFP